MIKQSKPKPAIRRKDEEYDSEDSSIPSKRTRTGTTRLARTQTKEADGTPSRSARAAKLKANKRLDAQAKELAEFQRQSALLLSPQKVSTRHTRPLRGQINDSSTPAKRPVLGTRASARLRGPVKDNGDDEWQQIPDEWLQSDTDRDTAAPRRPAKGKGKGRAVHAEDALEEIAQAGLGSDDAFSELTELSDDEENTEEGDIQHSTADLCDSGSRLKANGRTKVNEANDVDESRNAVENTHHIIPKDFVEWEAVSRYAFLTYVITKHPSVDLC